MFDNQTIQSIIVAISAGIIGGLISVWTSKAIIGILLASLIAYITELVIREIRGDPQYEKAKQELINYLDEN